MVPRTAPKTSGSSGAPRASGDGPALEAATSKYQGVLPARAGMVPHQHRGHHRLAGAPRASGDGPNEKYMFGAPEWCSPRERGWSLLERVRCRRTEVLPARAGMVLSGPPIVLARHRAPRASGDGPWGLSAPTAGPPCSPRERGWSGDPAGVRGLAGVLPARAGMVRQILLRHRRSASAPRASGDGPSTSRVIGLRLKCSPRERGWSHTRDRIFGFILVLPARAGMVPRSASGRRSPSGAPRASEDGPSIRGR